MRIFALILSLYVLFLACMPCSDGHECHVQDTRQITTASIAVDHQAHEHALEMCSPLCSCICCGCIVAMEPSIGFEAPTPEAAVGIPGISIPLASYDASSIWQPPKIG